MPIYEYQCDACGDRFERIQRFSDPPIDVCPACGQQEVRKLLSPPALQFKGSGFYITDYASKGPSGADGKGDAKKGDAKEGAKGATDGGGSKESGSGAAAKPAGASDKAGTKSSSD